MRPSSALLSRLSATAALALLGLAVSAKASTIINVVNGGFETLTTPGTTGQLSTTGTSGQNVIGWTNAGYNFVFSSDSSAHANGNYNSGNSLGLWSATPGPNNTLVPNGIGPSPLGGNFLALDGAYETGPISQVISGLTVGEDTQVSFWFAGAQQNSFTSATTEAFTVSLGTESHSTAILSDVNHGFTGWNYTTIDFVPTAASETLSFLAAGTPNGQPPFSLLDGISVVQVTPEPSTLALLGTGVLAIGGLLRRRRGSVA